MLVQFGEQEVCMESDVEKRELTESEVIDRQVEEIMADGDSGEGDKKRKRKRKKKARSGDKPSLKERWKGYSRKRKIITVVAVLAVAALVLSRCGKGGDGSKKLRASNREVTK